MGVTYDCKNKCASHRIGGENYVGTHRTKTKRIFVLKYCKICKVYYDTTEERCFCCRVQLRSNVRKKYSPKNVC